MGPPDVFMEDISDRIDAEEFFPILEDVYRDHQKDPEKFLSTVFSFVDKKTKFFKSGDPRHKVIYAMRKAGISKTQKSSNPEPPTNQPKVFKEEAAKKVEEEIKETEVVEDKKQKEEDEGEGEGGEVEEDSNSKGLVPNSGNGADLGKYSWTQDLHEVFVTVPLPEAVHKKMLNIKIEKTNLSVSIKNQEPIISGELCEPVVTEESWWSLDGKNVEIALQKKKGMTWWKNVIKGDPEINTQKVCPENSKLSDLDGETRAMVEKMMDDNRRKQMGLPTSEDEKKMEILKKFQAAHPEMDFSKAKMM